MNRLQNRNGVIVVPSHEISAHIDLTEPQQQAIQQHAQVVETIMTTNALRHVEGAQLDWSLINRFNAGPLSEKAAIFQNPLVSSALLGFYHHGYLFNEDIRSKYTNLLSEGYPLDWRTKEEHDRLYDSGIRIWIGKTALGAITLENDPNQIGTLVERRTFVAIGRDNATPRPIDRKHVFGHGIRDHRDTREIIVAPMTTSYYAHKTPRS